ncbi:MAG: FmdB family zinc ribbon protein, partial [Frankiaceae bacterium]
MPTYEYVCTECGQDLEVVQTFSEAALTECPRCSGKLRKRYSPVGVVFKGSGFYKTDSRQKPRKGSDDASKPAAATAGDGEAAGGTAKSDAGGSKGADGEGGDRRGTDRRGTDRRGTDGRG